MHSHEGVNDGPKFAKRVNKRICGGAMREIADVELDPLAAREGIVGGGRCLRLVGATGEESGGIWEGGHEGGKWKEWRKEGRMRPLLWKCWWGNSHWGRWEKMKMRNEERIHGRLIVPANEPRPRAFERDDEARQERGGEVASNGAYINAVVSRTPRMRFESAADIGCCSGAAKEPWRAGNVTR